MNLSLLAAAIKSPIRSAIRCSTSVLAMFQSAALAVFMKWRVLVLSGSFKQSSADLIVEFPVSQLPHCNRLWLQCHLQTTASPWDTTVAISGEKALRLVDFWDDVEKIWRGNKSASEHLEEFNKNTVRKSLLRRTGSPMSGDHWSTMSTQKDK